MLDEDRPPYAIDFPPGEAAFLVTKVDPVNGVSIVMPWRFLQAEHAKAYAMSVLQVNAYLGWTPYTETHVYHVTLVERLTRATD